MLPFLYLLWGVTNPSSITVEPQVPNYICAEVYTELQEGVQLELLSPDEAVKIYHRCRGNFTEKDY